MVVLVFVCDFVKKKKELIIGQMIALARRLGEANAEMHSGVWKKYTTGRYEIRGKTLGIVGYGNIGEMEIDLIGGF
jgi:phosphoglycerate dehydrogenase-like enzyme